MADIKYKLISGDEEDDQLYATVGADQISGLGGNDVFYNIGVIDYSAPDAFVTASPGYTLNRDSVYGGDGNDTFMVQGFFVYDDDNKLIFDGGDGTDTLNFNNPDAYTRNQRINERAGVHVDMNYQVAYTYYQHDSGYIWTDREGRIIFSGIENVTGTDQGDYINGDGNDNVLDGGTLDYSLENFGLTAHDPRIYGANKDIINGNGGNDTFKVQGFYVGGTYDGGEGSDTLDFSTSFGVAAVRRVSESAGIHVNLQNNVAYTYFTNYDYSNPNNGAYVWTGQEGLIALKNIENVKGTAQNDYIYGSDDVANVIEGGAGNDYLHPGNAWNVKGLIYETVNGGDGDDYIVGGGGNSTNTLNGGNGNDYFLATGSGEIYDGGGGIDTVDFSQSKDGNGNPLNMEINKPFPPFYIGGFVPTSMKNIEVLIMTSGADYVDLNYMMDKQSVLNGADPDLNNLYKITTIYGGDGNDTLKGSKLTGYDNKPIGVNRFIYGGDGNDILDGGYYSNDILDGGTGKDYYFYKFAYSAINGTDTILSFDSEDVLCLNAATSPVKTYTEAVFKSGFSVQEVDSKSYLVFTDGTYIYKMLDVTAVSDVINNENLYHLYQTGQIIT